LMAGEDGNDELIVRQRGDSEGEVWVTYGLQNI
jgi:hypothetical protein